jgi:hypothetical protein
MRVKDAASMIEPLEQRRLMSAASYSALDLTAMYASHPQITGVGINDAGIVLANAGDVPSGSAQAYTYSTHRHRLYKLGNINSALGINNLGQVVNEGGVYNSNGQPVPMALPLKFAHAVNDHGVVLTAFETSGMATSPHGHPTTAIFFQPSYFNLSTGQSTTLPTTEFPPIVWTGEPSFINDNGLIASGGAIYDTTTGTATSLLGGNAAVNAMSNTFVAGLGGGQTNGWSNAFIHNLQDGTDTIITPQGGESEFFPTAVNDAGIVAGNAWFHVMARNHTVKVRHAAIYLNGQVYDLNSMITLPRGLSLMQVKGINASGQIVALSSAGNDYSGNGHTIVLNPIGVTGKNTAARS